MPDGSGPNLENPEAKKEKHPFITQKIKKKPASKGRIFRHVIKIIFSAVLFGVVAVITLVLARPYAVKYFARETTLPVETVKIPRDEPTAAPETEATVPETQSTTSASQQETESEAVKNMVNDAMESYPYSMDDLVSILNNLRGIADRTDRSVVAVNSVKTQKDWFDNSVQTSGLFSGIVIARTDSELMILTTGKALENADALKVTFNGGGQTDAVQKRLDAPSGLAVLSVSVTDANRKMLDSATAVELGNSYQVKRGDPLVLTGSPQGTVHSVDYGFASYIARNVSVTDRSADVIYTDGKGNASDGTWVLNTDGQLIGWVTDAFTSEENKGPTMISGISDYKSVLEHMTNGQASPLLGITGAEVTKEVQDQGVPAGIYVTSQNNDGPTYRAGIQAGDIITSVGGNKTETMQEYTAELEKLHAEDSVKVTVMRTGRENAYTPLEFQVTVGAR